MATNDLSFLDKFKNGSVSTETTPMGISEGDNNSNPQQDLSFLQKYKSQITIPINTSSSEVEKQLEDVSVLGMDIENKKLAAATLGAGYMLTDVARGVAQMYRKGLNTLGIADEETALAAEEAQQKAREMSKLYSDPKYGKYAIGGSIVGGVLEPSGFIIPAAKGKKLWDLAKYGMKVGGTFGFLGYVNEEEGRTRLTNTTFGALTGGILSPTVVGGVRAISKGKSALFPDIQIRKAKEGLQVLDNKIEWYKSQGKKTKDAVSLAKKDLGFNDADVVSLELQAKTAVTQNPKVREAMNLNVLENNLTADNILSKGSRYGAKQYEEYGEPIYQIIGRRYGAKNLQAKLGNMEYELHVKQTKWLDDTAKFREGLLKVKGDDLLTLQRSLRAGTRSTTLDILRRHGGQELADEYLRNRPLLDHVYQEYTDAGYKLPKLPEYFPTAIKDMNAAGLREDAFISAKINEIVSDKGYVTGKDVDHIIENMILNRAGKKTKISGSLRKRILPDEKLNDEILKASHHPADALELYLRRAAEDIEIRKFFRGFGINPKIFTPDPVNPAGVNYTKGIGQILLKEVENGNVNVKDVPKIAEALAARFGKGMEAPGGGITVARNLINALTIGNPLSAIVQVGDLPFITHKYSIMDTVMTLLGPKVVKAHQIGIMEAAEDLATTTSASRRFADRMLKWSGFSRMDRLMKETSMNTFLRHMNKRALNFDTNLADKAKFMNKWKYNFSETQLTQAIEDFKNKRFTHDIGAMMFMELMDYQPIAKSKMPKAWLNHPKGRLFYTLRSFTLSQLDYQYNILKQDASKGKNIVDLMAFLTPFYGINVGVDVVREILVNLGNDPISSLPDEIQNILADNAWMLIGASRYTSDMAAKKGPGAAAIDLLSPPITVLDRPGKAAINLTGGVMDMVTGGDTSGEDLIDDFATLGNEVGYSLPLIGKFLKAGTGGVDWDFGDFITGNY